MCVYCRYVVQYLNVTLIVVAFRVFLLQKEEDFVEEKQLPLPLWPPPTLVDLTLALEGREMCWYILCIFLFFN